MAAQEGKERIDLSVDRKGFAKGEKKCKVFGKGKIPRKVVSYFAKSLGMRVCGFLWTR